MQLIYQKSSHYIIPLNPKNVKIENKNKPTYGKT